MATLVAPMVQLIGFTDVNMPGLTQYLEDTGQLDFLDSWRAAIAGGMHPGEALCSFYAKLCYKSLVLGKNSNVSRTRDIQANFANCQEVAHGSVFEHCFLNFVAYDCSRVLTHELVRHRVGSAFSQTSGRYCRLDEIDFVADPVLLRNGCGDVIREHLEQTERLVYLLECKLQLREPSRYHLNAVPEDAFADDKGWAKSAKAWIPSTKLPFGERKKRTSAIRRIAPNGQANEIGFSLNIRSLRHLVHVRTSRHSEWEIRDAFGQVYNVTKDKFPHIFADAKVCEVDGLVEVFGMKHQPYETLAEYSTEALRDEIEKRSVLTGGEKIKGLHGRPDANN